MPTTKNLSDSKPVACAGEILRRTDSHVLSNNKMKKLRSGDSHLKPPMINFAQSTTPDDDPRWGEDCHDVI